MLRLRMSFFIGLVIVSLVLAVSSALAYKSGAKWQNTRSLVYYIDPNISTRLGVSGSDNLIKEAAARWNQASWFRLNFGSPYNSNGNTFSTANFQQVNPCTGQSPGDDSQYAVNCLFANPATISRTTSWFNVSPSITWNATGSTNCNSNPRTGSVLAMALHEFGHWYNLKDRPENHPEAVMWFNCTTRLFLAEDDKHGATLIYGPWSSWENGQATGEINRNVYRRNVVGYFGNMNPPPELGPRRAEMGVPVQSGQWYELMAGTAQSAYSYAYFDLFTWLNDSSATQNYVQIKPGMKLVWLQYNLQQRTMSVDFEMTDGTTLRDSGLRDQNGIHSHPAARGVYPIGQWLYFEVDLSPLAGKTIRRYMIGYDNGNNGIIGQFRAYFDDIQLRY